MLNRIMLVAGACEEENFQKIKTNVMEKLNAHEQAGVCFQSLDALLSESAFDIILKLQQELGSDPNVDFHELSITLICDDRNNRFSRFLELIKKVNEITGALGIFNVFAYIIWMLGPNNGSSTVRFDMLQEIRENTHFDISNVFILTDRHSDVTPCYAHERIRAAALLINTLVISKPRPGVYTVGIGSKSISSQDICAYTRHRCAELIRDRKLEIKDMPSLRSLCAEAFKPGLSEEDLTDLCYHLIGQNIVTDFCYIIGSNIEYSKVEIPSEADYSSVLDAWKKGMIQRISLMLYPDAAVKFFSESEDFVVFLNEIKSRLFANQREQSVKVPLWGMKKDIVVKYNAFLKERRKGFEKCAKSFFFQWEELRIELKKYAEECLAYRNKLLIPYFQERDYIETCVKSAPEVTHSINSKMLKDALDKAEYDTFVRTSGGLKQETIDHIMQWVLDKTEAENSNTSIIAGMANWPIATIHTNILDNIHVSSTRFLACAQHNTLVANTNTDNYIYFAPGFPVEGIRQSVQGETIVGVNNKNYSNVEGVSLLMICPEMTGDKIYAAARSLTAFAMIPAGDSQGKRTQDRELNQEGMDKPINSDLKPSEGEEQNPSFIENLWDITVVTDEMNRFKLSCKWLDKTLSQVNAFVLQNQMENGPIILYIDSFNSYEDITDYVFKGKCILELRRTDNGEVLSRLTFQGQRTAIQFERGKEKNMKLNGCEWVNTEIMLNDMYPSEDLSHIVVKVGHSAVSIPLPRERKEKQYWRVITRDGNFTMDAKDQYKDHYQVSLY